jgi:hypothetical protein
MRPRRRLQLAVYGSVLTLAAMLSGPAFADTIPLDDPLHGYCAVACIDNGTNSPTTQNPPVNFGFTVSPGPASGAGIVPAAVGLGKEALPTLSR